MNGHREHDLEQSSHPDMLDETRGRMQHLKDRWKSFPARAMLDRAIAALVAGLPWVHELAGLMDIEDVENRKDL